jgi:hypothetical protein
MAKGKKNGTARGARKRRGKSESMTGKKAGEVEVRTGELDLQQIEINDDDFDLHFRAMKGAVDRQKTAKNLYDGCCKAAKKVSPELLDAVKRALKFEGMDPADIKRQMEIDGYVLKRTASPIQLTVFDTLAGDVADQAYKRGYDDGENGRTAADKYPAGSDLSGHYTRGWRHGTAKNLGLTPEQADAAAEDGDELPIPQPEGAGERRPEHAH